MLVDTHCHLSLDNFKDDLERVLDRAREAQVERIVVPGIDLPTSRGAVSLAEARPGLYAAVGIHPHNSVAWSEATAAELRDLSSSPAVVAVGEIGLDYYRDHAPREDQLKALRAQLELAAEMGLPVIVHNRNSVEDLLDELEAWVPDLPEGIKTRPGVLHSFSGDAAAGYRAAELGFSLGVAGPLTYPSADRRREITAQLPLASLLIETDAPYLAPQPRRGKRNEPAYVRYIGETLAGVMGTGVEEIAERTTSNAAQLFGWSHGTSNGNLL